MTPSAKSQPGLTRDAGYQVGARQTLPIALEDAWQLVTSESGLAIWLGDVPDAQLEQGASYTLPDGTRGEVRVLKPNSHLRLTWQPSGWEKASRIQVRVIASSASKTTIAFHQEMLPGPVERKQRKEFFKAALDRLENLVAGG